jgi:hypothetical protein
MTTPTQEEKDRALEWVRSNKCSCGDIRCIVERCYLHATAELVRSEERLRELRDCVEQLPFALGGRAPTDMLSAWSEAVLKTDDKLASGENEETKMHFFDEHQAEVAEYQTASKFTPKPGDRVRLESSPDRHDQDLVGRTGVLQRTSDPMDERVYWTLIEPNGRDHFLHRDAVFAPAPAQAEQPPADASGVAAGEALFSRLWDASGQAVSRTVAWEWFDAWRASVDAEVAEFRRALGSAKDQLDKWRGVLSAKDAEVAELKREVGTLEVELEAVRIVSDTLRQELEAEKAARANLELAVDIGKRAWEESQREVELLSNAQKARAVPSVYQLVTALINAPGCRQITEVQYEDLARAVWSLLHHASPPASPDNTPPEPLPSPLPSGSRTLHGSDVSGYVLRSKWCASGRVYSSELPGGPDVEVASIDWAHWRSQQNQDSGSLGTGDDAGAREVPARAETASDPLPGDASLSTDRARLEAEGWCFEAPSDEQVGETHDCLRKGDLFSSAMGYYEPRRWGLKQLSWHTDGGSVIAWRHAESERSKPIAPSPDAGIEAVKAEVAELRLQGLVTRRALVVLAGYIEGGLSPTLELARIEREEREERERNK